MSQSIPLTKGAFALIDDDCYPSLAQFRWRLSGGGYAIRSVTVDHYETVIGMHRQILDAQPGQLVDHIDHNPLNNVRSNLRLVTHQQNMMNRRANRGNSTGFKGVNYVRGKWQVRIQIDEQQIFLGYFDDLKTAALVYDTAARYLFGEYAFVNLPSTDASPEIEAIVLNVLTRRK